MTQKKIILFGGTFDPVHKGHIKVAMSAAKKICAEKILLVPAKCSPHKTQRPAASKKHRAAMLKLAVAGKKIFKISNLELNRKSPSWTIDTVRQLKRTLGNKNTIHLLIGADILPSLPRWHKIHKLLNECNVCIMHRGGFDEPNIDKLLKHFDRKTAEKLRQNLIKTPLIDISSSQIRQKLSQKQNTAKYLHPKVLNYIKKHKLYISHPAYPR
jgi:nicotinate-nucleotide adenylyltransferase